jgi:hypothetical protein
MVAWNSPRISLFAVGLKVLQDSQLCSVLE